MYHDAKDAGKGDRPRTSNFRAYREGLDRVFGKRRKRAKAGRYVWDGSHLVHESELSPQALARAMREDDRPRLSQAMGCPFPDEQAKRLKDFENAGVRGCRYDRSGRLVFPPGLENQKRLARLHGLDVM